MSTETKEINLHLPEGQKELIVRHGEAEKLVPFRESITITGQLDVPRVHLTNPSKWLTKVNFEHPGDGMLDETGLEKLRKESDSPLNFSHLRVERSARKITFCEDAGNPWESNYHGRLEFDPRFSKFKINSGESYTTLDLANFIKMNRSHFETRDKAMQLVSELRNFKAKVDKDVENAADDRGNRRILLAQAVESNIPESFKITVPVFKGQDPMTLEIEIAINPQDLSCSLISPEVNDYIEDTTDSLIDAELDKIRELFPNLRIFEV